MNLALGLHTLNNVAFPHPARMLLVVYVFWEGIVWQISADEEEEVILSGCCRVRRSWWAVIGGARDKKVRSRRCRLRVNIVRSIFVKSNLVYRELSKGDGIGVNGF